MEGRLAYLDASAFAKLVLPEPEEAALRVALGMWPLRASSTLLEVETARAVRVRAEESMPSAQQLLRGVTLIEVDAEIRRVAAALDPPRLRALDAIHLATALSLGDRLGAFYAYDARLVDAARAHGLEVGSPA